MLGCSSGVCDEEHEEHGENVGPLKKKLAPSVDSVEAKRCRCAHAEACN